MRQYGSVWTKEGKEKKKWRDDEQEYFLHPCGELSGQKKMACHPIGAHAGEKSEGEKG